jgi:hypothetical protein
MIETGKIAEILFEQSQNIPEYMYLHTMNMLKVYNESSNEEQVDNEAEIEQYILKFDNPLRSRIQKHITKPCCICYMPECHIPTCDICDKPCRSFMCSCCMGFIVLCIIGVVIWCIGTNNRITSGGGFIRNITKPSM